MTYTVYTPTGLATDYSSVSALRRQVDHSPVLGEMAGTLKRAAWHIRRSTLTGVTPALGDRITQTDGTVWVVLEDVSKQTDSTRWRLICQQLEGTGEQL